MKRLLVVVATVILTTGCDVSVNSDIVVEAGAQSEGGKSVNGSVIVGDGAQAPGADFDTVNGRVKVGHKAIVGNLRSVNDGTVIEGDLIVGKSSGPFEGEPPTIIIGANSEVRGTLRFEQPVRLFIHGTASTGPVEGATPERFSGEKPGNGN